MQPKHPYDPRTDLVTDRKYWKDILWNSWHEDQELYELLHYLRCGGAEVVLTVKSYMLLPGNDEWNETEWEQIKQKHLNPNKDRLISILKITRFALHTNEELPEGIFKNREVDKCLKSNMEQLTTMNVNSNE